MESFGITVWNAKIYNESVMSRSKKKNPGGGIGSSLYQHQYKKSESRAARRRVRSILCTGDYDKAPHPKEYGNEWASPRDGKQYWVNHDAAWMRK